MGCCSYRASTIHPHQPIWCTGKCSHRACRSVVTRACTSFLFQCPIYVCPFSFMIVSRFSILSKMVSMIILILASSVHWGQTGIGQLKSNWQQGRSMGSSPSSVAKQIYYGFCLGMLGLTGFECAHVGHLHFFELDLNPTDDRHPLLCLSHQTWKVSPRSTKPSYSRHHLEFRRHASRVGDYPTGRHTRGSERTECFGTGGQLFPFFFWLKSRVYALFTNPNVSPQVTGYAFGSWSTP